MKSLKELGNYTSHSYLISLFRLCYYINIKNIINKVIISYRQSQRTWELCMTMIVDLVHRSPHSIYILG